MEFTTSKKDMKKGISRIPLEMARLKSEDMQVFSGKTEDKKDSDQEDYS